MEYFKKFVSNTLAGSSNQSYFYSDNTAQIGRTFYKIFAGGKYDYSFLFTNIIDSTYADGSHSKANIQCPNWTLNYAKVMVASGDEKDLTSCEFKSEHQLTFNKKISKES